MYNELWRKNEKSRTVAAYLRAHGVCWLREHFSKSLSKSDMFLITISLRKMKEFRNISIFNDGDGNVAFYIPNVKNHRVLREYSKIQNKQYNFGFYKK